jgi:CheY-like chemotaxis protein
MGGPIGLAGEAARSGGFDRSVPVRERVSPEYKGEGWADGGRAPVRVVVTDDEPDIAKLTAKVLQSAGYAAMHCCDGISTINLVQAFAPQLVLLDLAMPRMDGFEVARALRRSGHSPDLRIIAVTAFDDREHRDRAQEAGFDAFLAKPFDLAALEQLVADVLQPRGA